MKLPFLVEIKCAVKSSFMLRERVYKKELTLFNIFK